MEVFPLDIQRMLLRFVSNNYIENLRHLYCVNRMFRRWVSRYVIDTTDKAWFLKRVLTDMSPYRFEIDFSDWNIFEKLSQEWSEKSPTLLSSFVMYLHARSYAHLGHFRILDRCSNKLFYTKQSILKDVKKKTNQVAIQLTQNRVIKREQEIIEKYSAVVNKHNNRLTNAFDKREAVEEVIDELDKKYKKSKK